MNDAIVDFAARVRAAHAEAPPREQGDDKVLRPVEKTEREQQLMNEFASLDNETKLTAWSHMMIRGTDDMPFACYVHFLFHREILNVFRDGVPDFLLKKKGT